jgi:uncharacterized membrane protein YphA (DoxX/SURF4 family)
LASWTTLGGDPAIDPVIIWTLRIFLAVVLVRAAGAKLWAPVAFAEAIHGYALLPAWPALERAVAGGLLALEVTVGLALLVPSLGRGAALAGAAMLLLYTAAIVLNLARGRRDIDCGCAGPLRRTSLHEWLVARNVLYGFAALVAALPAGGRTVVWLDALTVVCAVSALSVLAVAFEALAARAPELASGGGAR